MKRARQISNPAIDPAFPEYFFPTAYRILLMNREQNPVGTMKQTKKGR
jgi:hypothetical protein